jgi:hypothetical protein
MSGHGASGVRRFVTWHLVGWRTADERADVNTGRTGLQLARIVVLLVLLRATGWYADIRIQQTSPLEPGELWGPWTVVSLVSVLFVAMVLVGRLHRHAWSVLTIEAAVAAVLAFVPPLQWVVWFGVGPGWIPTMGGGFVQPLAVAWLGVVVAVGFRQLRATRAAVSRPSPSDVAASA